LKLKLELNIPAFIDTKTESSEILRQFCLSYSERHSIETQSNVFSISLYCVYIKDTAINGSLGMDGTICKELPHK